MSSFRKERTCPSSFELADAACGAVEGLRGLQIASHLAKCDFCAAETALYQAFPPVATETKAPEIPRPLFELAEALLAHETIHISRFKALLGSVA
jgi:anti-sigma factor ChrR (cupin superfamily)